MEAARDVAGHLATAVVQEDLDAVAETYEQAEDIDLAEDTVLVAGGHTVAAVVGVVHKLAEHNLDDNSE